MPVTIKDVAKLAGVSPSTVSRTCNNSPLISEKTQVRVREAMKVLGYQPPEEAEDIQTADLPEPEKALGVILPPRYAASPENPFFLEILQGITHECNRRKALCIVLGAEDDDDLRASIENARSQARQISFVLLYSHESDSIASYLHEAGLEYVLIGKPLQYANETVCVDNDNIAAGQDAAQYLIDQGHRRIAFIGYPPALAYSAARRNGYRLALSEAGIPLQERYCLELDLGENRDTEPIRQLLALDASQRPSAIVCVDDLVAWFAASIAAAEGLSIPEDLSLIAFNNSIFARLSVPPLTSMEVNPRMLGMEAAARALEQQENAGQSQRIASKILIPHALKERQSVACLIPAADQEK